MHWSSINGSQSLHSRRMWRWLISPFLMLFQQSSRYGKVRWSKIYVIFHLIIDGTPCRISPLVPYPWARHMLWFSDLVNFTLCALEQVSIGADEYNSSLADDYNNFVDTMVCSTLLNRLDTPMVTHLFRVTILARREKSYASGERTSHLTRLPSRRTLRSNTGMPFCRSYFMFTDLKRLYCTGISAMTILIHWFEKDTTSLIGQFILSHISQELPTYSIFPHSSDDSFNYVVMKQVGWICHGTAETLVLT